MYYSVEGHKPFTVLVRLQRTKILSMSRYLTKKEKKDRKYICYLELIFFVPKNLKLKRKDGKHKAVKKLHIFKSAGLQPLP